MAGTPVQRPFGVDWLSGSVQAAARERVSAAASLTDGPARRQARRRASSPQDDDDDRLSGDAGRAGGQNQAAPTSIRWKRCALRRSARRNVRPAQDAQQPVSRRTADRRPRIPGLRGSERCHHEQRRPALPQRWADAAEQLDMSLPASAPQGACTQSIIDDELAEILPTWTRSRYLDRTLTISPRSAFPRRIRRGRC